MNNEEFVIKLRAQLDTTSKTVGELNTQIKGLEGQIKELQLKVDSKQIGAADKELKTFNKTAKQGTQEADSWQYSWKKAFQSFTTYMSVTTVFYQAVRTIRNMIDEVMDLDAALVELRKVTDLEGESLKRFTADAYQAAEAVAKTGTEMVEAATEFAKAGYDEKQILKLGEIALMYTNVADEAISAADSAEFIIAQMKAFNIEAEDAIHIIDAVNEVSNNFAVSSADIANNLGKSSAVMANAGNSYEQMIGLLTAGTEVTRNASKVSNGLKTITLRLQGMNDEGEESLELTAQMEKLFNKLGLSVYKADGSLKNTYEILQDLAPIYQEATAAEKAFITETIAGKYQAQNAAAILNNFGVAIDATTTALDSNGSAARENGVYLDSIEGKVSNFKSSFEQLSNTLISSDLIKWVVDFGTVMLKAANSDAGQFIMQITALGLAIKVMSTAYGYASQQIGLLTNSVLRNTVAFTTNKLAATALDSATKKSIISLLSEKGAIDKNTGSIKTQTLAKIKAKLATTTLTDAEKKEILTEITMTATQSAATKTTNIFTAAWHKLTAAIAANPIGLALVAITALVSGLKYLSEGAERAKARYDELQGEFEEATEKVESTNEELETTNERIKALKAKGSLTFAEQEELNNLELANKKLEVQLELYKKIAEAKEKEAKKAANDAYNADYNGSFSYKKMTNDGQLKDMKWYDYINPVNIYNALSGNDANYGFDDSIITEAVNKYSDLANQAELTKKEIEQMTNLEISLMSELEKLEEMLPNLSGEAKKEAQELRDYIVKFTTPDVWNKEKANEFFSADNKEFQDTIKLMDELAAKGELTGKKLWELRQNEDGTFNAFDEYLRRSDTIDNEGILAYYEDIAAKSEETAEREVDAYQEAAKVRQAAGKGFSWDDTFLGYLSGEFDTNAESVLNLYNKLKELADAGELSADKIRELDEQFKFLATDEYAMEDIVGILQYFNEEAATTLSDYSSTLDGIIAKYDTLTSAVDEYNEAGYMSLETLNDLMNKDLLGYLSFENGQLVANTSELYNMAEAERIAASQKLYDAMATDILAIANGDVESVSSLAQSAVANLGNNAETAGTQAANATGKFIGFAEAVDQTNKALAGKEITSDIQEKINAVQGAYKPYFDLLSQSVQISKKKYTGSDSKKSSSSSSSKTEKEWWETELEKLKEQFKYSEITIDEYIGGLEGIMSRLDKGSDAWRKINEELQKQKLSKIEDDYKRGTISLDQYISKLKELIKTYKQGTEAWNDLADKIKKALIDKAEAQKDDYKTAYDTALKLIDKEIDAMKDLRDETEDYYDQLIKDKEKANDETEREIELARLQEALANAQNEKNKRVWREGLGWVWEADQQAIADAQKELDDFMFEDEIRALEEARDAELAVLDDQIKAWEDYKNAWQDVVDNYELEQAKLILAQQLGADAEGQILAQRLDVLEKFKTAYIATLQEIDKLNNTTSTVIAGGSDSGSGSGGSTASAPASSAPSLSKGSTVSVKPGTKWYGDSYGGGNSGTARGGAIKYINTGGSHPYNIDGLGWVRKSDIVGYRNGGIADYTGLAMLHGTPNKPEYILNNDQMRNLLSTMTKPQTQSNMNCGTGATNYNFGNIELPNVNNAQQFITELKSLVNITKHQ